MRFLVVACLSDTGGFTVSFPGVFLMPVLFLAVVLLTGCASVPRGNCHMVCDIQAKTEVSDETSSRW